MARPVLTICTSCEAPRRKGEPRRTGEELLENVRARRKERGLKEQFKVQDKRCLGLCDTPCVMELSGKKRSTYLRTDLDPQADVEGIVDAAVAYAALPPGDELPERLLPGEHAD